MSYTPQIQSHEINSVSDWPLPAQLIASVISERLPHWVAHGPYPSTASFASHLVPQLNVQATEECCCLSFEATKSLSLLRDTFDVVMSSCADLRTLVDMPSAEPVFVKAIFFNLVAHLVRSFLQATEIRTRAKLRSSCFQRDQMAELLLVRTIFNDDIAASEDKLLQALFDSETVGESQEIFVGDTSVTLEEVSHEALKKVVCRRRGDSWYEDRAFYESDAATELSAPSSESSLASLDVPESAHIVKSSRPRTFIDVPLVCVAEAADMPSVMERILHQRRIWDIKDPVLGLVVSQDGLTARVAIGWLREYKGEITANWASASSSSTDQSLGVYHLIDPLACISFAHFILGLERNMKDLSSTIFTCGRESVFPSWSPNASYFAMHKGNFIELWRLHVAEQPQLSVDSPDNEASYPITTASSCDSSACPTATDTEDSEFSDTSSETSDSFTDCNEGDLTRRRYSNFRRCGFADLSNPVGGTVLESLWDRNIIVIPHIILTHLGWMDPCGFTKIMTLIYEEDTEVEVPTRQAHFPLPDYRLYRRTPWTTTPKNLQPQAVLNMASIGQLSDRLCDIARCCESATNHLPGNTDRQLIWDTLFAKTWISIAELKYSTRVLFARGLKFSTNPYQNLDLKRDNLIAYCNQLRLIRDFQFSLRQSMGFSAEDSEDLETAEAARELRFRLMDLHGELSIFLRRALKVRWTDTSVETFRNIINMRCQLEPAFGICDSALVVPCVGLMSEIQETVFTVFRIERGMADQVAFDASVEMMQDFALFASLTPDDRPKPDCTALCAAFENTEVNKEFRQFQNAGQESNLGPDLLLPLLLVDFRKAGDRNMNRTSNESITHCTAALDFLKALGIVNEPVYSLVIDGTYGTLLISMYCQENPQSDKPDAKLKTQGLIMKWNSRTYNIANISDAYSLSAFMLKLAARGERLRERFEKDLKAVFLEKVKAKPDILKWTIFSSISDVEKTFEKKRLYRQLERRMTA